LKKYRRPNPELESGRNKTATIGQKNDWNCNNLADLEGSQAKERPTRQGAQGCGPTGVEVNSIQGGAADGKAGIHPISSTDVKPTHRAEVHPQRANGHLNPIVGGLTAAAVFIIVYLSGSRFTAS